MADLQAGIHELYTLEQLSGGQSSIHALHPLVKLLSTLCYLVCVMSFSRYELTRLAPYLFYPIALCALAEIPLSLILKRTLVALPFCLFAGLSNVLLDRVVLLTIGSVSVTGGVLSLLTILVRTVLCVAAVLILVAVTPLPELGQQLRRLYVPDVLVRLLEMTYRYIGALLEEASSMFTAYRLRGAAQKGIEMKHMGSFVGQLLLRSFDRAERVYQAMKCRGYGAESCAAARRKLTKADAGFLLLVGMSCVLFRVLNLPLLLGRLF